VKGDITMKVLCIVQARMGSERLPGKVIKPILDKPMILYTLDRLNKSKYIDEVILATSTENKEEPLVNTVQAAGYKVFRGDENNVLKRYRDAADNFGGQIIIRVTGDCPLIDPFIVDNVISYFIIHNYDYARLDVPDSSIRGFDVEVFSKEVLDRVYGTVCGNNEPSNNTNSEIDREQLNMYKEHVTLYMYRHQEQFNIGYVKGEAFYNKPYRLCVDTEEDFNLVEKVYTYFNNEFVSGKDVIKYLDENAEVSQINMEIKQKNV